MKESNFRDHSFFKMAQRSREYELGEYISVIDQVELAQEHNKDVRIIRKEIVDFYRSGAPRLFEGLDNCVSELGEINEGVQSCVYELGNVNQSLEQIRYSIDYGFDSVVDRLDQGNRLLSDIRHILSSPVKVQANEFLVRAMEFFRDGFYEEAIADFQQVVQLDPANFIAWYMIGSISFEQFDKHEDASEAFAKCDHYASKRGPQYFSKSLLQQALIQVTEYNNSEALLLARKSYEVDSKNLQACFLTAELAAETGATDLSEEHLSICERADPIFFLRSATSKPLTESGVHEAVFSESSKRLHKFNKETLGMLRDSQSDYKDFSNFVAYLDSVDRYFKAKEFAITDKNLFLATPKTPVQPDYMVMRGLHDELSMRFGRMHEEFRASCSELDKKSQMSSYKLESVRKDESKERERKFNFGFGIAIGVLTLIYMVAQVAEHDGFWSVFFNMIGGLISMAIFGTILYFVAKGVFFLINKTKETMDVSADNAADARTMESYNSARSKLLDLGFRNSYRSTSNAESASTVLIKGDVVTGEVSSVYFLGLIVEIGDEKTAHVNIDKLPGCTRDNINELYDVGDKISLKITDVKYDGTLVVELVD